MKKKLKFEAIVIGISVGGMNALSTILPCLPGNFALTVIIVQHLHPSSGSYLARTLNERCKLTVKEADEKEEIKPGLVYIAPPDYHLLIEDNRTFSFCVGERVNYTRPSIDVLFESASDVYFSRLIGIILTGANNDGSQGLKIIKERGGLTIVQDPETAESAFMPRAAIAATEVEHILPLEQIGPFLVKLARDKNTGQSN